MLKTKTQHLSMQYTYMFTQVNSAAAPNVDSRQVYPAALCNKDQA